MAIDLLGSRPNCQFDLLSIVAEKVTNKALPLQITLIINRSYLIKIKIEDFVLKWYPVVYCFIESWYYYVHVDKYAGTCVVFIIIGRIAKHNANWSGYLTFKSNR